ncbi:uncharacterized protein BO87DRAFT_450729 [Aspergillus neoniger CBS 115656]|uniref:Prion-inhibition and propagation HeLo domain-containing protein n=1 Tax=Aspergillus neoniger (strain CBS 115656) TaxID=1448310 RepID=A0A318YXJ9_ASPNB|nr:hypothetical protein BO87DRAFT_450729 [Aspergillus neoniger CBS 115656]PYH37573.1 hypothetical protein BO87DRAFT_450729 [Aspergillus neoniger CBS 115656]
MKKKRIRKWFDGLLRRNNGEQAAASEEKEATLNERSLATGLSTLQSVDAIKTAVESINGNLERLIARAGRIDERTAAIRSITDTIQEKTQEIPSKQDDLMDMQREMIGMQRVMMDQLSEQAKLFSQALRFLEPLQVGINFGKEARTSLLKLDVVKLRLTRWGRFVGLTDLNDVDIPEMQDLLGEILELIREADKLSGCFRNKNPASPNMDPSQELARTSESSHQQVNDIIGGQEGEFIVNQNEALAIYEMKDFSRLIQDIGGLVNDLTELFPAENKQCGIYKNEASRMDKVKIGLSLLKETYASQDDLSSETVVKANQSTITYNNCVIFTGENFGIQMGHNAGTIDNVRFDQQSRS